MCGRVAQTHAAFRAAAASLSSQVRHTDEYGHQSASCSVVQSEEEVAGDINFEKFNMSPGMDAYVFWKDEKTGIIKYERKVWGLVSKPGNPGSPLPKGMGKHFNSLMFNARSDTLYEKPTFARLANAGKTCLIAVDGFFEWRTEGGKKQPYFVYRNQAGCQSEKRPYLLFAGLWTSVATGYTEIDDPSTLDTFTIMTTDACQTLEWLHTRMPVVVWDEALGIEWLEKPSQQVHRRLEEGAKNTVEGLLQWHAVTSDMASMKLQSPDVIKPLPKVKTVKSFFAAMNQNQNTRNSDKKNLQEQSTSPTRPTPAAHASMKNEVSDLKRKLPTDNTKPVQKTVKKVKPNPSPGRGIDFFFKPKKN